jgi:hypothetical protein
MYHAPEHVFRLATRETANGEAGQIARGHRGDAAAPEVGVETALHNAKEILLQWTLVSGNASIQPAQRAMHGLFDARTGDSGGDDVVESHHDIGTDLILQMH